MKINKKAFTIIELLLVMVVIIILAGLFFNAFKGASSSALKASCALNIRNIVQAMHLYIEDYDGENIPKGDETLNSIYGSLYYTSAYVPGSVGGITNNNIYVCPATDHIPAIFREYGKPMKTNQTWANGYTNMIHYSIIKPEDDSFPDFRIMPPTNAVIWEAYFDNHGDGRHLGFWNQTVKFIPIDDPTNYPTNMNVDTGLPENYNVYTLCGPGIGPSGFEIRRVIDPNDNS